MRAALGLTAAEAVRALRRACRVAGGLDGKAVSEIVRDKRRALRRTPALSFHELAADLGQVGGLSELKRWLNERRRAFSDEARRFGLPTPRGLLLFGVQGCGKSLCAKAVAREWRFPLLRLDLASAFGGATQSPEAALREAVQVAESLAPAVLWIDEIEKGFAATSTDARASRVFGSFLTWLAEKDSPGLRGGDRQRRGRHPARAAAPRPLRRAVLRRPAHRRRARRDPRASISASAGAIPRITGSTSWPRSPSGSPARSSSRR